MWFHSKGCIFLHITVFSSPLLCKYLVKKTHLAKVWFSVLGNISGKKKKMVVEWGRKGLIVNATARNLIMIHTCIYESCIVVTISAELQK